MPNPETTPQNAKAAHLDLANIEKSSLPITALDLSNQGLNDNDLERIVIALKKKPLITTLNISGNAITDRGARILGGLNTIKVLDLSHNKKISQVGVIALAHEQSDLVSLSLDHIKIGDDKKVADALLKCPNLSLLSLENCKIGPNIAKIIAKSEKLVALNLAYNQVDDAATIALAAIPNLYYLQLKSNCITYKAVEVLAKSKSLNVLGLAENQLGDDDSKVSAAIAGFEENTELVMLDLSATGISDKEAAALARNNNLFTLSLARNKRLTVAGIKPFIKPENNIGMLDLSNLQIIPDKNNTEIIETLTLLKSKLYTLLLKGSFKESSDSNEAKKSIFESKVDEDCPSITDFERKEWQAVTKEQILEYAMEARLKAEQPSSAKEKVDQKLQAGAQNDKLQSVSSKLESLRAFAVFFGSIAKLNNHELDKRYPDFKYIMEVIRGSSNNPAMLKAILSKRCQESLDPNCKAFLTLLDDINKPESSSSQECHTYIQNVMKSLFYQQKAILVKQLTEQIEHCNQTPPFYMRSGTEKAKLLGKLESSIKRVDTSANYTKLISDWENTQVGESPAGQNAQQADSEKAAKKRNIDIIKEHRNWFSFFTRISLTPTSSTQLIDNLKQQAEVINALGKSLKK